MNVDGANISPLLAGASEILKEVKKDIKGSYDVIPDVALITLKPRDFSNYYQRWGAEKLEEYESVLERVRISRRVCGVAIETLKNQGVNFQHENTARSIAVTRFGVGECGEVSSAVFIEAFRRKLLPVHLVMAADQLGLTSSIRFHGFNIWGVSKEELSKLNNKHKFRLIPILQDLSDCIIVDAFLGIVGRVEEVRKNSSLFMRYLQEQEMIFLNRFNSIETHKPEISEAISKEIQMICQVIQQRDLFKLYPQSPSYLSRYIKSKQSSLSDQQVIEVLTDFSKGLPWQKSRNQEGTFWCQGSLERLTPISNLLTAASANHQVELRKVKGKEEYVLILQHADVHVIIATRQVASVS